MSIIPCNANIAPIAPIAYPNAPPVTIAPHISKAPAITLNKPLTSLPKIAPAGTGVIIISSSSKKFPISCSPIKSSMFSFAYAFTSLPL